MNKNKLNNVNPDTILVYVGNEKIGATNGLVLGKIYTILYPCYDNFNGTWKPAIYLKECPGDRAFLMSEFAHVPRTINDI